jgi:hypothetical protein
MFALTISGCCNACDHIALSLDDYSYAISKPLYERHVYRLRCDHQDVCGALAREAAEHPLAPLDQEY